MLRCFFLLSLIINSSVLTAQQNMSYTDSVKACRKNYIHKHEAVHGKDTGYFRFFPIDSNYRITCSFEKTEDKKGFIMPTAGPLSVRYFKYGKLSFRLHDTTAVLYIYQSSDLINTTGFKDYLFIPFTDNTTGYESYEDGKYLDLRFSDIKNNTVILDFNNAYNPDCAYTSGYSCPIPPKENSLHVAIKAGEMKFAKPL